MRREVQYVVPMIIIAVGAGWFLNVQNIMPQVDWIWTLGLAISGLLTLAVGGIDRLTIVVGPLLLLIATFSFLRQMGIITLEQEIPLLIFGLGLFLLIGRLLNLPQSEVLKDDEKQDEMEK